MGITCSIGNQFNWQDFTRHFLFPTSRSKFSVLDSHPILFTYECLHCSSACVVVCVFSPLPELEIPESWAPTAWVLHSPQEVSFFIAEADKHLLDEWGKEMTNIMSSLHLGSLELVCISHHHLSLSNSLLSPLKRFLWFIYLAWSMNFKSATNEACLLGLKQRLKIVFTNEGRRAPREGDTRDIRTRFCLISRGLAFQCVTVPIKLSTQKQRDLVMLSSWQLAYHIAAQFPFLSNGTNTYLTTLPDIEINERTLTISTYK